jgi:beta-glucanase (GH16 family)
MANSTSVPFNKDFFLLLNLAMGGGFGGPVEPAFTSAIYEIEYVRVYR